jgi:hypothetical protein
LKKYQEKEKKDGKFVLLVNFDDTKKFEDNGSKRINPEIKGKNEIKKVLKSMGIWFYIMESGFHHTVTVEIDTKPVQVIEQFRKTPTMAIKKIVPLDGVVSSDHNDLINSIKEFASMKIENDESFTVILGSNGSNLEGIKSPDELTTGISSGVSNGLNLQYQDKNTDWVIQIEELGNDTAIAVCRPDDILIK